MVTGKKDGYSTACQIGDTCNDKQYAKNAGDEP